MREYASISPQFWIGETGKLLRGKPDAQVLALYLMSSPHSNMIGVYHCPIMYMAHETGLGMEGASKALQSLVEANFCYFDEATEIVFVIRMAAYQVGEFLKPEDNRAKGVQKAYKAIASRSVRAKFFETYAEAMCLTESPQDAQKEKGLRSPSKAPPKQLTGTGTGTGTEAPPEFDNGPASAAPPPTTGASRGTRLPKDWQLPDEWRDWCLENRPDLNADVTADSFRDFWVGKAGKDAMKLDWQATWRNWVRGQKETYRSRHQQAGGHIPGAI